MFSVIVPTYNRVALLARTIDSVLRQTHADFELIVVSDGSTDGTDAYLSDLQARGLIRHIRQSNSGPSVARSAGLAVSRGEFIAFTDDDCVVPTSWLAAFARVFTDASVMVVGGPTVTGNPGNIYALTNDFVNNFFKSALNGRSGVAPYLTSNNVAYRRSILDKVGGHDRRYRVGAEDRDLDFRVQCAGGRILFDPQMTVTHYNDANFTAYVRHQYRQGQGSHTYYSIRRDGDVRPPTIPKWDYVRLLFSPFRPFPFGRALTVCLLIVLAQIATAAGFASAILRDTREPGS